MTLGDRIVIMKDGVIQQIGTPGEVFDHPHNMFVGGFIGSPQMKMIHGCELVVAAGRYFLRVFGVDYLLPEDFQDGLFKKQIGGRRVVAGIRAEDISLAVDDAAPYALSKIDVTEAMGAEMIVHMSVMGSIWL
jgi:multiple sugar transport system ATP-binding protein